MSYYVYAIPVGLRVTVPIQAEDQEIIRANADAPLGDLLGSDGFVPDGVEQDFNDHYGDIIREAVAAALTAVGLTVEVDYMPDWVEFIDVTIEERDI